jgi:putative ABC transport system ATP-binding protein
MARSVMELLEEINAAGTTIIMVTHDPHHAARAQRNEHIIDGQVSDQLRETAASLAAVGATSANANV